MNSDNYRLLAPGLRISIRGEDFLVTDVKDNQGKSKIVFTEGISELVKSKKFVFDTAIDTEINVLDPLNTNLVADDFNGYQKTKLFIETHLRNAHFNSNKIEISHKAAIDAAPFQYDPTIKSLKMPRPRILIADGVGLGKTIEVGIFLSEQIKRGRGQRILVLALKSILGQFQQEIWSRFAVPLVRLDSVGIARIKTELPANKNPFDYYDKTIISIDTLKNNAKFRHYIEKSRWDIIVIDECHTVANISSLRGNLAQFLATKCESLVLTSATPHNGKKESFANLITMIEPTAIPRFREYSKQDVESYYVRRFKKDVGESVKNNFKDREVIKRECPLNKDEEAFLQYQQNLKVSAIKEAKGNRQHHDLLFSIGLFKAYLSSPEACLQTLNNRIEKVKARDKDVESSIDLETLTEAKRLVEIIIKNHSDSKYNSLIKELDGLGWKGRTQDERIIIFSERIKTLETLESKLKERYGLTEDTIKFFHGTLSDVEQQELIEDFGKEDSQIRVLLTSDAGAQGVNLHFYCNKMFNYDVPWSIITLEQRNGRIDRYGQKKTPYIYYLLNTSNTPGLKTDLHIIEKLGEKEYEIHRTLGDAASFLRQYDSSAEETVVEKMIIEGDDTALDKFDWTSLFGKEEETTEVEIDKDPVAKRSSFYSSDFEFYKSLIGYLKSKNALKQREVEISNDGLIEIINTTDLDSYLFNMPSEAKVKRGETYKLTANKELVQQAIEDARKRKGEWPKFQMLYDLHPIVKVLMNRLEASIDKDVALVVKTNKLPKKTRWYLFHGQVSNNLGQSVLSEFIVVSLREDGSFNTVLSFDEFVQKFKLNEHLYNEEIPSKDVTSLKDMLKDAIGSAFEFSMNDKQAKLKDAMEMKKEEYQKQLNDWYKTSKDELELEFNYEGASINPFVKASKERRIKSIETILSDRSQYYIDMTSLENKAFLELLAVFYY